MARACPSGAGTAGVGPTSLRRVERVRPIGAPPDAASCAGFVGRLPLPEEPADGEDGYHATNEFGRNEARNVAWADA